MTAGSWDFWYGLSLNYKEQFGDVNAPRGYKTKEGFLLGNWQLRQRKYFKKGRLSLEKAFKMEAMGFKWGGIFDEQFDQGFQETLRYKEVHGTPNAPLRHRTVNGFQLGRWQGSRRQDYEKGSLEADKIQ